MLSGGVSVAVAVMMMGSVTAVCVFFSRRRRSAAQLAQPATGTAPAAQRRLRLLNCVRSGGDSQSDPEFLRMTDLSGANTATEQAQPTSTTDNRAQEGTADTPIVSAGAAYRADTQAAATGASSRPRPGSIVYDRSSRFRTDQPESSSQLVAEQSGAAAFPGATSSADRLQLQWESPRTSTPRNDSPARDSFDDWQNRSSSGFESIGLGDGDNGGQEPVVHTVTVTAMMVDPPRQQRLPLCCRWLRSRRDRGHSGPPRVDTAEGKRSCGNVCLWCRKTILQCCCPVDVESQTSSTPSGEQQQRSDDTVALTHPSAPAAQASSLHASSAASSTITDSDNAGAAAPLVNAHKPNITTTSSYDADCDTNPSDSRQTENPVESQKQTSLDTDSTRGDHTTNISASDQPQNSSTELLLPDCREAGSGRYTGRMKGSGKCEEQEPNSTLPELNSNSLSAPMESRNAFPPLRKIKTNKSSTRPWQVKRQMPPLRQQAAAASGDPQTSTDSVPVASGPDSRPYRPDLLQSGRSVTWTVQELETAGVNQISTEPPPRQD